jgi:hypothetical protein
MNEIEIVKDNETNHGNSMQLVCTFTQDLLNYGYLPTENLFIKMQKLNEDEISLLYHSTMKTIQAKTGLSKKLQKYPDFPKKLKNKEHTALFSDAVFHFLSTGKILPIHHIIFHNSLININKVRIIKLKGESNGN